MGSQTRALRTRKLIEDFLPGAAKGTYWGINTRIADYELQAQNLGTPMVADNDATRSLSDMRTRLNKVLPREQGQLINWGCGLNDAAMRRFVLPHSAPAGHWPNLSCPL
jgi:NTE family protein